MNEMCKIIKQSKPFHNFNIMKMHNSHQISLKRTQRKIEGRKRSPQTLTYALMDN